MMNAAEPMIGGMICPPVEPTASKAAAHLAGKPDFFIIGIVNTPVPITFAMALPEIMPNSASETSDIFAEPPVKRPVSFCPTLTNVSEPPV